MDTCPFSFDPLASPIGKIRIRSMPRRSTKRPSSLAPSLRRAPGIGAVQQLQSAQTEVAFSRYLDALIAARQRQPQEDVLSALITARVEGVRPLDEGELHTLIEQLLFAGHETTTNLLSTTLLHLLRDATLWAALHADPGLIASLRNGTLPGPGHQCRSGA